MRKQKQKLDWTWSAHYCEQLQMKIKSIDFTVIYCNLLSFDQWANLESLIESWLTIVVISPRFPIFLIHKLTQPAETLVSIVRNHFKNKIQLLNPPGFRLVKNLTHTNPWAFVLRNSITTKIRVPILEY